MRLLEADREQKKQVGTLKVRKTNRSFLFGPKSPVFFFLFLSFYCHYFSSQTRKYPFYIHIEFLAFFFVIISKEKKNRDNNRTNHLFMTMAQKASGHDNTAKSNTSSKQRQGSLPVSIHPDDAKDKVFTAILKALSKMGNKPSSPKELANIIVKHKYATLGYVFIFLTF